MEAVKGFIFGHGKTELGHKYLVSFILVTEQELKNVSSEGETIMMGSLPYEELTAQLQYIPKFKPPHPLGNASNAIITVSNMSPEGLERVDKSKKKVKKNSPYTDNSFTEGV